MSPTRTCADSVLQPFDRTYPVIGDLTAARGEECLKNVRHERRFRAFPYTRVGGAGTTWRAKVADVPLPVPVVKVPLRDRLLGLGDGE